MTPSEAPSKSVRPFAAHSLVGKVLSERYRIEALLGEGGMGAVYLAEHVLMRKRLAVKVLHPEMTRMSEIVARFEREAMAAAHIEHPNVAAATDFGKLEDGTFFLVLEYVEGTSLRDAVANAPLGVERTLHIAYQMAAALARAHALGIVHRDLKPENVMLVDRDGDPNFVKVLDFGIAKVPMGELALADGSAGQVLTQLGMVYGTPEYMAPEQALGEAVDARADLYALGVMMFEMLTGVRPFESDSKVALLGAKVTSDPPSLASKNPAVRVSPHVEALVRALLDKDARQRPESAHDVLDAIDACRFTLAQGEAATGLQQAVNVPASARYQLSLASVPRAQAPGESSAPGALSRASFATLRALRAKLPPLLRALPPVFWVAAAGVSTLLLLVWGLRAASGPHAKGAANGSAVAGSEQAPMLRRWLPPPTAPAEVLAAAVVSGAPALDELAAKYPEDPAVWRALVRTSTKDKRGVDAMRALAKLLSLQESASGEDDTREALVFAASSAPEAANAAFALMESGMDGKGPDLMFELLTQKGTSPKLAQRLKQSLANPDVKARMSPALAVAVDFRNASGCDAKKTLLARVKEQGDARMLATLRSMQATKGCGFLGLGDCWSCLRRDGALAAAESAIEERSHK
jgi:serine/threonine protein kinase